MSRFLRRVLIVMVAGVLGPAGPLAAADGPGSSRLRWEPHKLIENLNEGLDVADVNRDGKLDVIAGPNWFEAPSWKRHRLREIKMNNEEFLETNGDHAIDLNGDGWVDVMSGSWFSDKLFWYENPGRAGLAAGKPWRQHLITGGQGACEGLIMDDLDGDGVPEIVVNSWNKDKPQTIVRIKPGVDGKPPTFQAVEIGGPGTGHGAAVGDINGDGQRDLFVCRGWYEQPAGNWHTRKWRFHKAFDFHHVSLPCVVADVNGDGKNDIIVAQAHDYGLRWLEQGPMKQGEITWTDHEIDKSFSQMHCLVWVDLDGDGRRELITGKRWRGHKGRDPGAAEPVCLVRYVWNPSTSKFEKDVISYDQRVGTGMQIRVADLDGDRRPDLAVAGKTGTYLLFNRGPAKEVRGETQMNRLRTLSELSAILIAVVLPLSAAANTDPCFDKLPIGWRVTKSFIAPQDQAAAIGKKLGAPIRRLSNTSLSVHGQHIQVNILEATSDSGAITLHKAISKMKGHPAFCLRNGKRVIEFVGNDVALATKVSYELAFVQKPSKVRYRVIANIATVDQADYMSFNKLFNLFLKTTGKSADKRISSQIAELSDRFQFGSQVTLRKASQNKTNPVYKFVPTPLKKEASSRPKTVTYSFGKTPQLLGVPYVTLTADITTQESGSTATTRKADQILLASTAFWPADDPEIMALAKRITAGKRTREAKVDAILKWLAPDRNIKFGGPVAGSRWGVKKVLQQEYGQCWDFSDCFVTLSRASGIPCRQVGGWLYGTSGHIWAEVLIEAKEWQQVDPTGGGKLKCGIYHIPYFVTEDGNMPILYVSMPRIEMIDTTN